MILEDWQKINADPVCFGALGSGLLKTMKLVHKSGLIYCNRDYPASYWGCTNQIKYGNNSLMTIITDAKKVAILSPAEELKEWNGCPKNHFYSLDGTTHKSPELVFRNLPKKVSVSRNQDLQIWYGQDWIDCEDNKNGGMC